jgi:hypothetical protein
VDRAARFTEQRTFFSTGRIEGEGLEPVTALGLVPAAFAPYRDLARLRHDFPVVLARDAKGPAPAQSLTDLVDRVLRELAPQGMEGERLRRKALALEHEIRARAFAGEAGTLAQLWEHGAAKVGSHSGDGAEEVLRYTATALKVDGDVVACDAATPARFVTHAWEIAHAEKARAFRGIVDALVVRLADILRAAFVHSAAGASAVALEAAMGARAGEFDFEAMSRLVGRRAARDELPPARRARIESSLATLRTQRFYPDRKVESGEGYSFQFPDCASVATAFRERLPSLVETVKAIAIAELEADGRYDEPHHDPFFEGYGEHSLTSADLDLFPDYLVCLGRERNAAPENANLLEILSAGLPVKILVETGDALEETAIGAGRFAFGVRSARLAMTATSLGGVFVLQAPGSDLFALRERLAAGLRHRGPALFSVFAGCDAPAAGLPPYLTAAAALRSRAFPSFSYDPHAGSNLAARFSFENDPEPQDDWPVAALEYSDEAMQRVVEKPAFTFADFALCDRRFAAHFARVPRDRWNAAMLSVADWLALGDDAAAHSVPYLLAVDGANTLNRVLVDASLMGAMRRCLVLWHRLQEMGGIHNSHAERLLAREKAAWEAQKAADKPGSDHLAPSGGTEDAQVAEPSGLTPSEPGMPWIETARCPSCNECQLINDKLFLYNENKQAYLGDLKAGTYRQMVEAAESCQVSIIHPGKPWNPDEPGLEELAARAQPFQ